MLRYSTANSRKAPRGNHTTSKLQVDIPASKSLFIQPLSTPCGPNIPQVCIYHLGRLKFGTCSTLSRWLSRLLYCRQIESQWCWLRALNPTPDFDTPDDPPDRPHLIHEYRQICETRASQLAKHSGLAPVLHVRHEYAAFSLGCPRDIVTRWPWWCWDTRSLW